ncbi:unnamed protein product [Rhizophagus irregularis]|nr:unnamed protein product [Rhizophagus irregularis]
MNFENPKNLWKDVDPDEYQYHVTISDIGELDERVVDIKDLEKREQVYGICGECNEPGTDDSSCISTEFLNEIKSHLQIYLYDVIPCYGITQDPDTKDYMMVLEFCIKTNKDSEVRSEVDEYDDKIRLNRTDKKISSDIQTHPQAVYTSRLLNFKDLPEPINSDCLDCQLDESTLREISQEQDDENSVE